MAGDLAGRCTEYPLLVLESVYYWSMDYKTARGLNILYFVKIHNDTHPKEKKFNQMVACTENVRHGWVSNCSNHTQERIEMAFF